MSLWKFCWRENMIKKKGVLEVFGRAPVTCFSIFLAKWTLPSCREDDAHPISSKVRNAIRTAQPVIESADDVNSISIHTSVALAKNRTDKNITALFKACQMNSGEREKRASTSDKRAKKTKKLFEAQSSITRKKPKPINVLRLRSILVSISVLS